MSAVYFLLKETLVVVQLVKCIVNLKPHGLLTSFSVSYPEQLSEMENNLSTVWKIITLLHYRYIVRITH